MSATSFAVPVFGTTKLAAELYAEPFVEGIRLERGWIVEIETNPVVRGRAVLRGEALNLGIHAAVVWLDSFDRMTVGIAELAHGTVATILLGSGPTVVAMLTLPCGSAFDRWTAWSLASRAARSALAEKPWTGMVWRVAE